MTDAEKREAAHQFINRWMGRGNEDEDGRSYWLEFLSNVMGMENPTERVNFEKKVIVNGNTKRIDVYIPETHVIIEQKSLGKSLDQKIHNSGDVDLTPYEQAKRYNDNLPYDEKARWIITCNFSDIWIYDMNARVPEPVKIALVELQSKYLLLDFLVKQDVKKLSHGGYLFLSPDEKDELIQNEPESKKFVRRVYGAEEFINSKERYCLWLRDISPKELNKLPMIKKRVQQVREFRLKSTKAVTVKSADSPTLFQQIRQPDEPYIIVPRVSSENRRYIPMGYESPETIITDSVQCIPNADLYTFGIITSNVHMAWTRVVCGRLKSDYRYSAKIVYNNFPWPEPTEQQKQKIEETAHGILDARALFPDSSLADLYDPLTMPVELRKAHIANDKAVMAAYGFGIKMTEEECVAELMKLYQKMQG